MKHKPNLPIFINCLLKSKDNASTKILHKCNFLSEI